MSEGTTKGREVDSYNAAYPSKAVGSGDTDYRHDETVVVVIGSTSCRQSETQKPHSKRAAPLSTPSSTTTLLASPYFANKRQRPTLKSAPIPSSPSLATTKTGAAKAIQPQGKKKQKTDENVAKTSSFSVFHAGRYSSLRDKNIPIHTLILGTHPSEASLQEKQYYGLNTNAFWWIVGDCLGFRRAKGLKKDKQTYLSLTDDVRHGLDKIIPYERQLELLCSKGFALWDLVQSCRRAGSLDMNIKDAEPNDIASFCKHHTGIRRIVLTNGGGAAKLFVKLFPSWVASGELVSNDDDNTRRHFGKRLPGRRWEPGSSRSRRQITCVVAMAVSPAAARAGYAEKRDYWEKHVYGPGLADFDELLGATTTREDRCC